MSPERLTFASKSPPANVAMSAAKSASAASALVVSAAIAEFSEVVRESMSPFNSAKTPSTVVAVKILPASSTPTKEAPLPEAVEAKSLVQQRV